MASSASRDDRRDDRCRTKQTLRVVCPTREVRYPPQERWVRIASAAVIHVSSSASPSGVGATGSMSSIRGTAAPAGTASTPRADAEWVGPAATRCGLKGMTFDGGRVALATWRSGGVVDERHSQRGVPPLRTSDFVGSTSSAERGAAPPAERAQSPPCRGTSQPADDVATTRWAVYLPQRGARRGRDRARLTTVAVAMFGSIVMSRTDPSPAYWRARESRCGSDSSAARIFRRVAGSCPGRWLPKGRRGRLTAGLLDRTRRACGARRWRARTPRPVHRRRPHRPARACR